MLYHRPTPYVYHMSTKNLNLFLTPRGLVWDTIAQEKLMAIGGKDEVKAKPDPQAITAYDPIPPSHLAYLTSIEVISNTHIRLYFSIRLKPTDELLDVNTYEIQGPSLVTITDVVRYKHKKLDIIFSGLLAETAYALQIVNDIFDVNENEIKIINPYNIFSNLFAAILTVAASSYNEIDIVFNASMMNNADLTDLANYVLTYAAATAPLSYTLQINSGVEIDVIFNRDMSLVADLCTPANYSIVYIPGTTPLTYTVAMTSPTELIVAFNNNMHIDTTLINPTKYSIASSTTPIPLSYSAVAISSTEVEIVFSNNMDINTTLIDPTKYVITL